MFRKWWLSNNSMAKIVKRTGYHMVQKQGRIKKLMKVGKISGQDDILTVKEKQIELIVNKTKSSLEMTPRQRELEARQMKKSNMSIEKRIEKEKKLLSDIGGKIF